MIWKEVSGTDSEVQARGQSIIHTEVSLLTGLIVSIGLIFLKWRADPTTPVMKVVQQPGREGQGARVQMESHKHTAKYMKTINLFNKLINRTRPVKNMP